MRRHTAAVSCVVVDSCSVRDRLEERRVYVEDRNGLRVREVFVRLPETDEWVAPVELLSRQIDEAVGDVGWRR